MLFLFLYIIFFACNINCITSSFDVGNIYNNMKSNKLNCILRGNMFLHMIRPASLDSYENVTIDYELQEDLNQSDKASNITNLNNTTPSVENIQLTNSSYNYSETNTSEPINQAYVHTTTTSHSENTSYVHDNTKVAYNQTEQIFKQGEMNYYQRSSKDVSEYLLQKYKGRVVCINANQFPHCDIYLCGTLHVAQTSVEMVRETVQKLNPNYVVLELCESRIDSLEEHQEYQNITFSQILQNVLEQKTVKSLGMGLLSWMQLKAAKLLGSKLGGELAVAAKEAYLKKATIVLGDRLYGVTIQRLFDQLNTIEKIKMVLIIIWESLTMSIGKIKDYIKHTETNSDFIKDEIAKFAKYMPAFSNIVVSERDEYLAQTICEIATVGFGTSSHLMNLNNKESMSNYNYHKGIIIAVVGAGHLPGIEKHIHAGGISYERLYNISISSKHNNTWPGKGMLHVIDPALLYNN